MTTDSFKKKFLLLALEVSSFLKLVITVDVSAADSIYEIMSKKTEMRTELLKKPMFGESPDLSLKYFNIAQVRQIFLVSWSVENNGRQDKRVRQLLFWFSY